MILVTEGHQGAHHISVLDHLVLRALLTHGGIVAVQHIEDLSLLLEVQRIDVDLAGVVLAGITKGLQVAFVGGAGGHHFRLHQLRQIVLGHVEPDGIPERICVDLQRAFHLAAQRGEALGHLALQIRAMIWPMGLLHGSAQLGLQFGGDLFREV